MRTPMDALSFKNWSSLISDTSFTLKTSMGTAIWIDGIETLHSLTVNSFFKSKDLLSPQEGKAFDLLKKLNTYTFPHDNFWVSGHISLLLNSPYYSAINTNSFIGKIQYEFTQNSTGEFAPWNSKVTLGTSFYSTYENKIRIPFYTFNHENTHLKFKHFYADLPISDDDLYQILILIEWYCISLDLILAYDLQKNKMLHLLKELYRVPYERNSINIFESNCNSVISINSFASKFRNTFLNESNHHEVFQLISEKTLDEHRDFCKKKLIYECRKNKSNLRSSDVLHLLKDMKHLSLTEIIYKLTGVQYE